MIPRAFKGAGGSSSKASTPVTTADNLFSNDSIEVILGLCAGPIKGLANGERSFYIGDTQYQNDDGTYNFDLFNLEINQGNTPGELITPVLGGFQDWHANELDLPCAVTVNAPTIAVNYNQLVVRLKISVLFRGGIDPTIQTLPGAAGVYNGYLPNTFSLGVEYMDANGVLYKPFDAAVVMVGKTVTPEYHEIRFPVEGPGPYTIYMTNNTPNLSYARCEVNYEGYYGITGGVFGQTRSDTVNTTFAVGMPILRTTDVPNQRPDGSYGINYIGLRLLVNGLYRSDTTGTYNAQVDWLIECKRSSATDWHVPFGGLTSVVGKTSSPYVFETRFAVDPITDTYDVRITLVTAAVPNVVVNVAWESMQEIVGGPIKYDGVATAHLVGQSSDQFSSLPDFWGVYDLKMVSLPTNYDPYLRTYTGTWDGTFKIDWTSNPAWILYDLAMSSVDGVRAYWPNFSLNKWDVYQAGLWCDQLVPNGTGGVQPRYTYNGIISDPRGIAEQLRYVAGVFNGTFLEDMNGNTRIVFDHNEPACALFTPENVTSDGFSYAYTDTGTRYNQITAQFSDPNLKYQTNQVVLEDEAQIAKFGLTPLTFAAIGCVDAHEARRRAAYKLLSATTEVEIVTFKTNRQAALLTPMSTILVSDPDLGNGVTGRIKALDSYRQTITLRDPVYLETGVTYFFNTQCRNTAYPDTQGAEPMITVSIPFFAITNGAAYAFELQQPLPPEVDAHAAFSLGSESNIVGVPKAYRVTKIEEQNGSLDNLTIEAVEINRNKLFLADDVANTVQLDYLYLPSIIAPPTGAQAQTQVVEINGLPLANIVITWVKSTDPRVSYTTVDYRRTGETTWISMGQFRTERADLFNIPNGIYDFRLQAIAPGPKYSIFDVIAGSAQGLNLVPPDVTGFSSSVLGDLLNLKWTPVASANLSHYWIRFSNDLTGVATWDNAVDLLTQVEAVQVSTPIVPGTYFIKAVSTEGVVSANAAFTSTSSAGLPRLITFTDEQAPSWSGPFIYGFTIDNPQMFTNTGVGDTATYQFFSQNFGAVYKAHISIDTACVGEAIDDLISTWDRLSNVVTMSGATPADFIMSFEIAISSDNGVTYSTWEPFAVGDWIGQVFAFRARVTVNRPGVRVRFYNMKAVISFNATVLSGSQLFVPSQGLNITFDTPFRQIPVMTITPHNAPAGSNYQITNLSTTGFTVSFTGEAEAIIDWQAYGFGSAS